MITTNVVEKAFLFSAKQPIKVQGLAQKKKITNGSKISSSILSDKSRKAEQEYIPGCHFFPGTLLAMGNLTEEISHKKVANTVTQLTISNTGSHLSLLYARHSLSYDFFFFQPVFFTAKKENLFILEEEEVGMKIIIPKVFVCRNYQVSKRWKYLALTWSLRAWR